MRNKLITPAMSRGILTLLSFFLILQNPSYSQHQAPYRDCSSAKLLIVNDSEIIAPFYGDILNTITGLSPIPTCTGTSNGEHWFKFVATGSAHTIYEENGFPIQAFSGTCGSLTSLGCASGSALDLTGLSGGQTYFFRIYYPTSVNPGNYNGYVLSVISPVTNNECSGAINLIPAPNTSADVYLREFHNYGATASAPSAPQGNNDDDVWFKFTATKSTHTIYVPTGNITPNATLHKQIFSGNCAGLVSMSSTSVETANVTGLSVGNTYYIRIYDTGINTLIRNVFSIAILDLATNDECSGADTLTMNWTPACENSVLLNRTATTQSTVPCGTGSNDVWYTFQAITPEALITVQAISNSALDITLFSGTCASLNCLTASSNSTDVFTGLTPGNYYYVKIDGTGNGDSEALCVSAYTNNDECADAISIPVNNSMNDFNTLYTTNYGSTQTFANCSNGTSAVRDVWYKFTATGSRHLVHASYAAGSSMYWELFSGSCGSLTSLRCKSGGVSTDTITGLTSGNDYYLRVFSSAADKIFSLAVINFGNDDCIGAISITPAPTPVFDKTILYSTEYASQSQPGCIATADDDVWFKFTAVTTSHGIMLINKGSGSTLEFVVEVFSGNCASLTSIACSQTDGGYLDSYTVSGLTPGQTYFVRVHSPTALATNRIKSFMLHIVNKPVNDEIAGAIKIPITPMGLTRLESYFSYGSTQSYGKFCTGNSSTPDHDTWYYFIATGSAHTIRVSNMNTFYNYFHGSNLHRIEAFDGYASDSITLASKLYGCSWNPYALSGLTAGDTVYFRVFSGGLQNTSAFGVTVENSQSIDEPQNAMLLTLNNKMEYILNTNTATQSLPPANCIVADFADDDIWVKFVANSQAKRIVVNFENEDLTMELFSGTPGALASIKCSDNILILPNNLSNGTTYYVRIYSKRNGIDLSFHIGLFGNGDITENSCIDPACIGTNLVPNPDCEFTDQGFIDVPSYAHGSEGAGSLLCNSWYSVNSATADWLDADTYFDAFEDAPSEDYPGSGITDFFTRNQVPRSGKGFLGILKLGGTWYEYVSTRLTQPLIPGKHYFVSFHTSMSDDSNPMQSMGAAFTMNKPIFYTNDQIPIMPQVTSPPDHILNDADGWMNVCGTFIADQAHEYLTIGFFKSANLSSPYNFTYTGSTYYFIDDVIVSEIPDTCFITSIPEIDSNDDESKGELIIYPNPSENLTTITWNISNEAPENIIVFDITGKQIDQLKVSEGTTSVLLDTSELSDGIYVLMGKSRNKLMVKKLVVQH